MNIPAGALGYGDDRGERARHPFLHADERVPAPLLELFPESGFGAYSRAAVDGDGVVDRGEGRHPAAERPHPVGEALVVVQDVKVRRPVLQEPERTQAEREGFGEAHGADPRPFHEIDRIGELAQRGHAERVGRVVQVEAVERDVADAFVQAWVRRPGDHGDGVAEIPQRPAQVFHVHPLAAAVRVAAVAQHADPQWGVVIGCATIHGHSSLSPSTKTVFRWGRHL